MNIPTKIHALLHQIPLLKNAYQLLLEQKIANNPNNYHYNNRSNIKIDLKIHIAHE